MIVPTCARTSTRRRDIAIVIPEGVNTVMLWRSTLLLADALEHGTTAHEVLRRMLLRERERLRKRLGPARADQLEREYKPPGKRRESTSKGPPDRADTFVD